MAPEINAVLLLDCRGKIEQLLDFTREASVESALRSVCDSITANPLWNDGSASVLVVRSEPEPLIAVFGETTGHRQVLLRDLAAQLSEVLDRRLYIDYHAAESLVGRLAERLVERFGRESLARFRYTAVPRGGLIVLGMLAYVLDLRPDQIVSISESGAESESESLVIVDDCALTGVRLRQVLASISAANIVFCPIFAHPDLCCAVERAEARVKACVHVEDLKDVAPERFGAAYQQWYEHRSRIMDGRGYWVGIPEYIAFAWNEPETRTWNSRNERFEPGWNVLPPSLCLKRRIVRNHLHEQHPVFVDHPAGIAPRTNTGKLQPADRVLWTAIEYEGKSAIAVARMPDDGSTNASCFRLEGTSAEMWCALIEHGSSTGAESAILARYEVDPDTLRKDFDTFCCDLVNNGILESG